MAFFRKAFETRDNQIKDGAYLLLRVRSAHLEILGFHVGGSIVRFKTMRRKQKLASAKVTMQYFRDN